MAEKISGIYRITNTITNDFYIGSSIDVRRRWMEHKRSSTLKKHPNNPMYLDMKKYGVEKFEFQVIAEVEKGSLKETEQEFIEKMHPTYNSNRANGWDIGKFKEYQKEFYKEYHNQLCCCNGEIITLGALSKRFQRAGIPHPQIEAKKYLLNKDK